MTNISLHRLSFQVMQSTINSSFMYYQLHKQPLLLLLLLTVYVYPHHISRATRCYTECWYPEGLP